MKYDIVIAIYLCTLMRITFVAGTDCSRYLYATDEPQILTSPGYPIRYESNLYCWWRLTAIDPNKIVVMETVDSMIHNSAQCSEDYAKKMNGDGTRGTYTKWCSDSRTMETSTGRQMTIFLVSNGRYETRGFTLRYYQANASAPCSRSFIASSSEKSFSSPGYPIRYFNNLQCEYTIQTDVSGHRILIVFEESDIESASACQYDYLTITDMGNGNAQMISTMCGSVAPSYQSATNKVKLKFSTDTSKVNKGFKVKYKSIPYNDCTLTLTVMDTDSYIVSPGYPFGNYSNLDCEWTITSPDTSRIIELTTESSSIEGTSPSCTTDSVEVEDSDGATLGRFCGDETPSYISTGSNLTLRFSTDSTGQSAGFVLRYNLKQLTAVPSTCGGIVRAGTTSQSITSPGYPKVPLRATNCSWTIQSEETGDHIFLALQDMDIEVTSFNCDPDSVEVFEGTYLHARWCGQSSGQYVQSTGQELTLTYTVDDSNNGRGFSVQYYAVTGNNRKGMCSFVLPAKDTVSNLVSPQFPNTYPNNLDCKYLITADEQKQIKVEAIHSSLPQNTGRCTRDYITVYDGSTTSSHELQSINTMMSPWCGPDLPTFVSSRSSMLLVFHTSWSTSSHYKGFYITYKQGNFEDLSSSGCGGKGLIYATSVAQILTSPNYPNDYDNNLDCEWTIRTSTRGRQIRITGVVKMENPGVLQSCVHDRLQIFEGKKSTSSLLSTMCGEMTVVLQSTDDFVTVTFSTDMTGNDRGFHLQFFETSEPLPCAYNLTATDRLFQATSKGYPHGYEANTDCTWLVQRDSDASIQLQFNEDGDEYQRWNCSEQYVNIYDGPSQSSPLIGQYCGAEELLVTGSGDTVFVQHVTGSTPKGKGFKILFQTKNGCPSYTEKKHLGQTYITSPNYPFKYPSNIKCSWRLRSENCVDCVISLTVHTSDIEYSEECNKDWMEVYDGYYSLRDDRLGRWCGTETPTYTSTGSSMDLIFNTDSEGVGTGFNISYTSVKIPTAGEKTSVPVGPIVGVFGAVIGIAVIAVAVFCLVRKPFHSKSTQQRAAPYMTYNTGQQGMNVQGFANNAYSSGGYATNIGNSQLGGQQAFSNAAYTIPSVNSSVNGATLPQNDTQPKEDVQHYAQISDSTPGTTYDNAVALHGKYGQSYTGDVHGESGEGHVYQSIPEDSHSAATY